jgi:hypothetical protein
MLPEELLRLICEFAGEPAAAYGMHLASLIQSQKLRDFIAVSLGRDLKALALGEPDRVHLRQKPQKRWRRRCGWELQQLYERPHNPLTAALVRAFGDPLEQQQWQIDLLTLLCEPLDACRELLLHVYPRKIGLLFQAFYNKLTPEERGDVACYAMLDERANYYSKLFDNYSFSFAHREGAPLYLAIARNVHFCKPLARQVSARPSAFRVLPWKEILESGGNTPNIKALLAIARSMTPTDPLWLIQWILQSRLSILFGEIYALTQEALQTHHAHALVRAVAPTIHRVCASRWEYGFVRVFIHALECSDVRANMDPLIFGMLDTDMVDEILQSDATWIHAGTLVWMLRLGWWRSVRNAIRGERVRAWTCQRAWTLLPQELRTRDIRVMIGLGVQDIVWLRKNQCESYLGRFPT